MYEKKLFTKDITNENVLVRDTKSDVKKRRFIMSAINITNARKELYNLVEDVNLYSEPTLIVSKKGNAVLVSESDWNAIQETVYLNSIPGMSESIQKGMDTPIEDCISEENVEW